ncbi:HNH endonuclease signature motif containing protein [Microbacterium tenebrionis]|uniref:HNH endonuclease signature motif containing protein n=1 Tax=Microbacterium tenebrionis TaxID=2830665 RepID=UPI00158ED0E1|nr:HNH endonuclease signature motif containing protein [Microbacterium ihumii]
MATFTDVAALIPTLCGGGVVVDDAAAAQGVLMLMPDADVVAILREAASVAKQLEQIQVAASGVIAVRSSRERGHSGLSQSRGHRSAASLIQDVTGSTKADANRKVRVGEALLDNELEEQLPIGEGVPESRPAPRAWHQPLRDALRDGRVTSAQFDAIKRGLGDPPLIDANSGDESSDGLDAAARADAQDAARAAWSQAAEQLVGEVSERTVEELWQAARTVRDLLDPEGAEARYLARFDDRSFRTYRGQDGQKRASMVFEDDGDLFVETMMAAALRPRRGGPRFVDPDEKAQAASLADDPRTTDQLAYDLLMDVIRAGALADAESVFGARQPGVRLVQVIDADGAPATVAHSEDGLVSIPGAAVAQHICDSGTVPVAVDSCGNPLDVGREHRLFTPKQRIALAIRDGGCRWRGCDRPSSYCEAHHIDEWHRDQGRTDIDRGILLCRYHHMTLHHGGWWITRDGTGDFVLHHPSGETFPMRPRAALSYAWGGIDPPPKRFRPAA